MDGAIPTVRKETRIPETGHIAGQAVMVRRLTRSDRVNIMTVASYDETPAGESRLQAMLMRASIVGAEGLIDPDTGGPLAFELERHPLLGKIASAKVYDALHNDILRPIAEAQQELQISVEQRKN